jgi:hypothetical protein
VFEGNTKPYGHVQARDWACLNILSTCRQLNEEAEHLAWENLIFIVKAERSEANERVGHLTRRQKRAINVTKFSSPWHFHEWHETLCTAGVQPRVYVVHFTQPLINKVRPHLWPQFELIDKLEFATSYLDGPRYPTVWDIDLLKAISLNMRLNGVLFLRAASLDVDQAPHHLAYLVDMLSDDLIDEYLNSNQAWGDLDCHNYVSTSGQTRM